MGIGGQSQKTKTKESKTPWGPAIPALTQALGEARDIYGGLDPSRFQPAVDVLQGIATGQQGGITTGAQYEDLISRARQPGAAENYLTDVAAGNYLDNPYAKAAMENAMTDATAAINRATSGRGRFGSGAHTGVMTQELGKIATTTAMDQFNRERQNQLDAARFLEQSQQGRMGVESNAIGGLTGTQTQQTGQQLGAAGQWLSAMTGLPFSDVSNLASIASTIGGMGGTSTGSQKSSGKGWGLKFA